MTVPRPKSQNVHSALLDAAGRLFYEHGIGATGVEAIADAAGVGKPAVYRHFRSKAGLIDATLARRDENRRQSLIETLARSPTSPVERLKLAVEWQLEWAASERFRGCGFLRAAAELDAGGAEAAGRAYAHKTWYRHQLQQLAEQAGAPDPAQLGMRLALNAEGATTLAFLGDQAEVVGAARDQAHNLIDAACGP
ncbi:MAG: TetR/AcrR family transcriptional regulator [Solirubrobacteraceae bacterium]